MAKYLTAPLKSTGMPTGIPYIVGNEAAERFSYYGMRSILVVFMTQYLLDRSGQLAPMSNEDAKGYFHLFSFGVYFLPMMGAIISDWLFGKYRTILSLSIVYCFGHLALALDSTRTGLAIGLTLIAIGSGGIKPCVSANVGDQFGATNQYLLSKVFGWFYFAVNFGSFFSTLLTPFLLKTVGPHIAFGVPGFLMFVATVIFWMGRRQFVHVPPAGRAFIDELLSRPVLTVLARLSGIFVFVIMFWSLYDQSASAWVLQAEKMNRHWFGVDWLSSQIQAVNPLLILIYIPLFSYVIYPAIDKVFRLTPLRKISIGLFLTAVSFLIPAWIEARIAAGAQPSIGWQVFAYVLLTAAEVMVSITCLEFSYTQAPKTMKSIIMALYLLSISLGNAFTSAVNFFIQNPDGSAKLAGANYYLFFAGLMFLTAIAFVFAALRYRGQTFLQDEMELAPT